MSDTLTFKAVTKPSKIKYHDLPGPMVRISVGDNQFYLSPAQAHSAAVKLLNLAAVARDAE